MAGQKEVPPLVVEFHYADGDVGVYPVLPGSHEEALWMEFADDGFPRAPAHHIVIRKNDDDGQRLSNRLMASDEALQACGLLISAYAGGEDSGGSVEWFDVDMAHESARVATTIARTGTVGIRRDGDDSPQPLTERDALARAERRQALACLRAAQALDGLAPFAVTHTHRSGQSTYLLWAKEPPSAEMAERPQDDAATLLTFLDDLETAMKALSPHLSEVVLGSVNEHLLREYGAAYLTRLKNAGS